jgi:HPt (histidine-containing phosphotransfer) domain-containing protein
MKPNIPLTVSCTIFEPSRLEGHIARNASRASVILEIVQNLVNAGDAPIREVRAAINRSQNHQAAHMLHTLYGSVANLGGCRVYELAGEIERLLDRDASPQLIEELMTFLEREFQLFLVSAEQWLGQQRKQHDPQQRQDRGCNKQLQRLCECLAGNDLRAFELCDELQVHLQASMAEQDYADFRHALQSLNFSLALGYAQSAFGT